MNARRYAVTASVLVSLSSCNNQFRFDDAPLGSDAGDAVDLADAGDTAPPPVPDPIPCVEHDMCPLEMPSCDELQGICIRCRRDDDCARDEPFCETVSGRCLECLRDNDCPFAKPRCDRPVGGCVACITSGDCVPPGMCDPTAHVCR